MKDGEGRKREDERGGGKGEIRCDAAALRGKTNNTEKSKTGEGGDALVMTVKSTEMKLTAKGMKLAINTSTVME